MLTCIYFLIQESLEKIAPTWMNVSLTMKNDPETDKAFGWVLEMLALKTKSYSQIGSSSFESHCCFLTTFFFSFLFDKVWLRSCLCSAWGAAHTSEGFHASGRNRPSKFFLLICFVKVTEVFSSFHFPKCSQYIFQPPWDMSTKGKFIIHYTYGCDYNMKVSSV